MTNNYLIEIKHVGKQSNTKQIRGEVKAAKDAGKQFVLFVKKDTELTSTLSSMKESGQIIVISYWKELWKLVNQ